MSVGQGFENTRILQFHNSRVLPQKTLDFRVAHRFGDMGGDFGGISTFYGMDQANDIKIAFEYGLTGKTTIGVARNKGAYARRQLFSGFIKHRWLHVGLDDGHVHITTLHLGSASAMEAASDGQQETAFENFSQRITHVHALLLGYGVDELLLNLNLYYVQRNRVRYDDENVDLAIATGIRFPVTHVLNGVVELGYRITGDDENTAVMDTQWGVGLEIDTGGHIFLVGIQSASGIGAEQLVPYAHEEWNKGQFRFGFTISRPFAL